MSRRHSFIILTLLFFLWGFITVLNDILIPYLKKVFELSYFQANLVQFAFFGAYFIGSLLYFIYSVKQGDPISKIGYKNGIVIGLVISSIACALFYPAASYHSYPFFLSALFLLGIGFTLLQIAANPYVAVLGTPETASSRLNLSQAFNSFGTTIGPVIGGYLIFKYFITPGSISAEAVQVPYLALAIILALLAIFFKLIPLPEIKGEEAIERKAGALQHSNLVFGAIAIFCYVGAEVSIGSNLVSFMHLPEIAGLAEGDASKYLAYYWGGAMIGRFMGAISLSQLSALQKQIYMLLAAGAAFLLIYLITGIPIAQTWYFLLFLGLNYVVFLFGKGLPARTLALFAATAIVLLCAGMLTDGIWALWALLAIGLFNSIMWSNIFTLSIHGLGSYTSQGSSLLVMMILGGALLPPLQGLLADSWGVHHSFVLAILCYAYLFFFGAKGYLPKMRGKRQVEIQAPIH
ncbi:MAG: sugar MFS transporter [Saprospiraceae bacterium]